MRPQDAIAARGGQPMEIELPVLKESGGLGYLDSVQEVDLEKFLRLGKLQTEWDSEAMEGVPPPPQFVNLLHMGERRSHSIKVSLDRLVDDTICKTINLDSIHGIGPMGSFLRIIKDFTPSNPRSGRRSLPIRTKYTWKEGSYVLRDERRLDLNRGTFGYAADCGVSCFIGSSRDAKYYLVLPPDLGATSAQDTLFLKVMFLFRHYLNRAMAAFGAYHAFGGYIAVNGKAGDTTLFDRSCWRLEDSSRVVPELENHVLQNLSEMIRQEFPSNTNSTAYLENICRHILKEIIRMWHVFGHKKFILPWICF